MTVPKAKHAGGRPSIFKKIDMKTMKLLVENGYTDKEIAATFKINSLTLYRWRKKYPEFCSATKDWKVEADAKVERSLYERATGYSHKAVKMFQFEGEVIKEEYTEHYPPDATSMIFWLKNRKRNEWRDKTEVDANVNYSAKNILDLVHNANKAAVHAK